MKESTRNLANAKAKSERYGGKAPKLSRYAKKYLAPQGQGPTEQEQ